MAKITECYRKHFGLATITEPADRPRAEAAARRMAEIGGVKVKRVVWVVSPDDGAKSYVDEWASLGGSLRASLGDSLGDSLRDSLWASLGDSKIEPKYTYWWGQHDLYWVAFYLFCEKIGVEYKSNSIDRLNIMHEIGLSCMWWYPRDGLIIACERPLSISMDGRSRLHNEVGPAVAMRDGWKIHSVHGVRVPAWIVEHPDQITPGACLDFENIFSIPELLRKIAFTLILLCIYRIGFYVPLAGLNQEKIADFMGSAGNLFGHGLDLLGSAQLLDRAPGSNIDHVR